MLPVQARAAAPQSTEQLHNPSAPLHPPRRARPILPFHCRRCRASLYARYQMMCPPYRSLAPRPKNTFPRLPARSRAYPVLRSRILRSRGKAPCSRCAPIRFVCLRCIRRSPESFRVGAANRSRRPYRQHRPPRACCRVMPPAVPPRALYRKSSQPLLPPCPSFLYPSFLIFVGGYILSRIARGGCRSVKGGY